MHRVDFDISVCILHTAKYLSWIYVQWTITQTIRCMMHDIDKNVCSFFNVSKMFVR